MNILLTGASGFIGRNLAAACRANGHRVVPASRRTGVDFRRMQQAADWLPHLAGIDAVVNAVGIIGEHAGLDFATLHTRAPIALFDACRLAGVRRVVQISALGTVDSAFSPYHRSKLAADEHLRSLALDWFVLRPSLIYGRSGGSAGLFMRLAALPAIPVVGDGGQWLQPIHISDVVATVQRALAAPDARQTLDIVGPSVTFADWLRTLRQAQGLPPTATLPIPIPLARLLCRAGRRLHPLLHPDNLRMLLTGYHGDAAPWTDFMGRPPTLPQPALFFSDLDTTGSSS